MNKEYKIFRVFCVFSACVLCVLLLVTGIFTAKSRTEQMVFGRNGETVKIYENDEEKVIFSKGRISRLTPLKPDRYGEILLRTVFSPLGNFYDLVTEASSFFISH